MATTLEFLGTTTFRLKTKNLVIFHDAWLERPSSVATHLRAEDVKEADYVLLNHAHFDHVPGADVVAKATGAKVIANAEVIRVLREQGVPEKQLLPVAGGEYIALGQGVSLRVYPGLHCLMPFAHGDMPDHLHTAIEYKGRSDQSPMDITHKMTTGLGNLRNVPDDKLPNDDFRAFKKYMVEKWGRFSLWDGGCLMFNIHIEGEGTVFFNGHTGAFPGILSDIRPRPDVAVLAVAGQPCVNGAGFSGTANEFIVDSLQRLGEPKKAIWALHDQAPIPPYFVDTSSLTAAVEAKTASQVIALEPTVPVPLF